MYQANVMHITASVFINDSNKVKLWGCEIREDNPTHFCKDCGHEWIGEV